MIGDVHDTDGLTLSKALWDALPSDLRELSRPAAATTVAVAVFVDALSEGYGMADEQDEELLRRAQQAAEAVPGLARLLSPETGALDAEDLRDRLYRSLTHLVSSPLPNETTERILRSAQIYWALSWHEETRPLLPLRGGEPVEDADTLGRPIRLKASIGLSSRGADFARLRRTARTEDARGMRQTSGNALREEGARIALRVAEHLVDSVGVDTPLFPDARIVEAPSGARVTRTLVLHRPAARPPAARPTGNDHVSAHRGIQEQARDLEASGLFVEAAEMHSMLVGLIRRRSESAPGDHEGALAAASLSAGFAQYQAGDASTAITHFDTTARISEMLAVLDARTVSHTIHLGTALTMRGLILLLRGEPVDAVAALARAVGALRDGADVHDECEHLLSGALSLLGACKLQTGDTDGGLIDITRAVAITRKLTRREPADADIRLLLAGTLLSSGVLHLRSGDLRAAGAQLSESAEIADALATAHRADWTFRFQLATSLSTLGGLRLAEDQTDEALSHLDRAEAALSELVDERGSDRHVHLIRAVTLVSRAMCHVVSDDEAALAADAELAVREFEWSDDGAGTGNSIPEMLSRSPYALAVLFAAHARFEAGEESRAEDVLRRGVGALRHPRDDDERERLSDLLSVLAELYEDQDRHDDLRDVRAALGDLGVP
ncbi:hypothetical protein [Microbacterium sp. NPDC089695]|uniref:hypothetical protein n=1 Tax=Microbacterium sp. NPDC089695 TaxID=3364198 RepID=UPI0038060E5B